MKQGCSERHYLNYYGLGGGGGVSLLVCWLQAVQASTFSSGLCSRQEEGKWPVAVWSRGKKISIWVRFCDWRAEVRQDFCNFESAASE